MANCRNKGPWFGNTDLTVNNEPFNKKDSCRSVTQKEGFMITTNEKGENMLTGLKEEWFSIEEMEVFTIEKIKFTIPKNLAFG
jgi:hypothetical protein